MDKLFWKNLERAAKTEGIQRFVVGAIIIKNSRFLLLERPKKDFMGGIYELPSGEVEDGESLEQALIREIKEETGMNVEKIIDYVGYFDYTSGSGKITRQFNFLVSVKDYSKVILQEHDNFVWSKKEDYAINKVTDSVRNIINKINFEK